MRGNHPETRANARHTVDITCLVLTSTPPCGTSRYNNYLRQQHVMSTSTLHYYDYGCDNGTGAGLRLAYDGVERTDVCEERAHPVYATPPRE